MLTKQLMGKVTAQDLAVESAAWYDEKDIVVLTGRTVTAIDPVGKTLVAGGTPLPLGFPHSGDRRKLLCAADSGRGRRERRLRANL